MNSFVLWMITTKFGRTFAIVVAILIGIGAGWAYFGTHYYNKGYTAAMHEIAVKTKKAVETGKHARKDVDDCYENGGDWDIVADSCLMRKR